MNIFASGMCVTNFHRVDNDIVTVALDAAVCGISSPGGGVLLLFKYFFIRILDIPVLSAWFSTLAAKRGFFVVSCAV